MRIFLGYGYNSRDAWIETDLYPILQAIGIDIVDGKDMHGKVLQAGVEERIEQADALIGFSTLRLGQENSEFNSHIWVRDEMKHALALKKLVVEVREKGVHDLPGLIGDRQRIRLDPDNRLSCVTELVKVVGGWSLRKLQLAPTDPSVAKEIYRSLLKGELAVEYRTRVNGKDSKYREGRMEKVNNGLYLNATGLPDGSLVQIKGILKSGESLFDTGWNNSDVVRIEF